MFFSLNLAKRLFGPAFSGFAFTFGSLLRFKDGFAQYP